MPILAPQQKQALASAFKQAQTSQSREAWDAVRRQALKLLQGHKDEAFLHSVLAACYDALGQDGKAEKHALKAGSLTRNMDAAYLNLAAMKLNRNQAPAALTWLSKLANAQSAAQSAQAARLHGGALIQTGQTEKAVVLLKTAVQRDPQDLSLADMLGNALQENKDYPQAIAVYRKILAQNPRALPTLYNLANAYQASDQYGAALEAYNTLLTALPQHINAHNNAGLCHLALGDFAQAQERLEAALKLAPQRADIRANLCEVLEGRGDLNGLAQHLSQHADHSPDLQLYQAVLLRDAKQHHQALELVTALNTDALAPGRLALYHRLRAQCLQATGQHGQALAAFAAMNQQRRAQADAKGISGASYLADIQQRYKDFQGLTSLPQAFTPETPLPFQLAFQLGFPRSGTTLLDTILRSHSRVEVIEEGPMVQQLRRGLPDTSMMGVAALQADKITALRQTYLAALDQALQTQGTSLEAQENRVVVDKLPLHLVDAFLLHRVFPEAKFVLSLRHPADVCLSCFMQDFDPNPAMANFFTLEDTAQLYQAVMQLWQAYDTRLHLPCHSLRYEDLIADMPAVCGQVLTFLGLDWEAALEDYQTTAKARQGIRTPSYNQVTQALYSSAKGRWQQYEAAFQPLMPQLSPWIQHWGYA